MFAYSQNMDVSKLISLILEKKPNSKSNDTEQSISRELYNSNSKQYVGKISKKRFRSLR